MAGDYAFYRRQYSDKTTDVDVLVGTQNYLNAVAAKSSLHAIYIQKITLSITTHVDQTITFDDDGAGGPVAALTDEATVVPTVPAVVVWDFGPKGLKLTTGANLDITQSAAGLVGRVHIEAYEKLEGPVSYLAGASSQ